MACCSLHGTRIQQMTGETDILTASFPYASRLMNESPCSDRLYGYSSSESPAQDPFALSSSQTLVSQSGQYIIMLVAFHGAQDVFARHWLFLDKNRIEYLQNFALLQLCGGCQGHDNSWPIHNPMPQFIQCYINALQATICNLNFRR